jgi:hypothetical protein
MAKLTAAQKAERVNRAPRSDKTDSLPVETRSPTVTIACKLPNGLHMDLKHPLTGEPHRVTVRGPLNARENRDVKTGLEAKDPNALPAKITVADGPKNGGGDDSGDDDDED